MEFMAIPALVELGTRDLVATCTNFELQNELLMSHSTFKNFSSSFPGDASEDIIDV